MNDQVASNWADGSLWVIVVFVGAFVLLGVMIWARQKNKAITPEQERRSEQATRDLYNKDGRTEEPRDRI